MTNTVLQPLPQSRQVQGYCQFNKFHNSLLYGQSYPFLQPLITSGKPLIQFMSCFALLRMWSKHIQLLYMFIQIQFIQIQLLEEDIERMWPPVDLWAERRQLDTPYPSPVLEMRFLPIISMLAANSRTQPWDRCWDHLNGKHDWIQVRPLDKLLRFWWAGVAIYLFCCLSRQVLYVSSLVFYTCHQSGMFCLLLSSILVICVRGQFANQT